MNWRKLVVLILAAGACLAAGAEPSKTQPVRRLDGSSIAAAEIDAEVENWMQKARVPGLALTLIQDAQPVYMKAYGLRNVERNEPLQIDTVMYAASLTKLIFAYVVMQLVDEKVVDLDRAIATYLKKPLPEYPKYADLAGDARWELLTPRMLLNHTPGFPNFRFLNENEKLDIKFEPGTRYAYSGEGYNLLQFVLEEGVGLDLGKEMQRRVFDRFEMARTSMTWRDDFAPNFADGYDVDGKMEPHRLRRGVRAAGSMDSTIADYTKFLAAFMRSEGLSPAARAEMLRPQIPITSAHQFPTLLPATNPANAEIKLAAGLGVVLFASPHGVTFFKGGHDDGTANMAVCVEEGKRCILLMSNSVRAEAIYPRLVRSLFGETRLPWGWEYNPAGSPLFSEEIAQQSTTPSP